MSERMHTGSEGARPGGGRRRVPGWFPPTVFGVAGVFLLAALAVGVLALLFSRGNPLVSRRVVAFISSSIGSDSTRIESDGIRGSVFGGAVLENPRLVVLTPDGPVTWMSAKRLRAEYDMVELLFSRNRRLTMTFDSPVLSLVHDRRGNLVVPRFRKARRRSTAETATRINIRLHDGRITLDRGNVRFGHIDGVGIATLESDKTTVRIARISGLSEMPGRPGRLRGEGTAVVSGGRMRIDPLYVALDRTKLRSAIEWDLEKARVVRSRTGLAPLDLAEAMTLLDITPVAKGTLVGEVSFFGDPSSGGASLRLSGTVEGEPVDALFANATLVPGAIRVESARARVRNAEVTGRATIETRGALTAVASFRNVDPARLPWWSLPANTPHGLLSGTARVRARKARPYPLAEIALDLDRGRLGRLPLERGSVGVRLGQRGDVTIDTAWVDTPGARLFGSGRIAADTTLAFSMQALVRDLGAMDSILGPFAAEAGVGRVTGSLSGRPSRPDYQLQGLLTSGRLASGIGFDSLRVISKGRLGGAPLATADIDIARLSAGDRSLGDVVSSLTITDKVRINRYRQTLGDTTLTFLGEVRFQGKKAEATLDSLRLAVGAQEWKSVGPVEASLEGERLEIARMTLGLDSGRIDLAGTIWLERDRIDARGAIAGVELGRVLGNRSSANGYRGTADGDLLIAGPLADPEFQLNLHVTRPRLAGVDGDTLWLDLDYAPGLLSVSEARWAAGPGRVTVSGSARPRLTFQEWIRALSRGDREWASRVDLALAAGADSFDLHAAAPLDTSLASLHGYATATARITGTAANPAITLEGRGSAVAYQGVRAQSARFRGSYGGRRLAIEGLELRQDGASSSVRGSMPIDLSLYGKRRILREEPIELHLTMVDADFGLATLFVPQFAASAGKLNVNADMTGTLARPTIVGSLKLVDGILRAAGRDEVLEGMEVDASFDERQVNFSRIVAREGKRGRVAGSGWWKSAERKRWGEYEFRLRATEFTATDRETYMFRFSGDFLIEDAVNLEGTELPRVTTVSPATLSRGELTMDLSQPREEPPEPRPFVYEIVIDVPRNLWYRNLDTEVELINGQLTLRNEGPRDVILGSLEVKGKYYIYSNEFQVIDGEIEFTTLDRIDPDINIEARTMVRTPGGSGPEPIYQTLSGRSSKLKVHLHDDRNSSEAYLWKVLTIGQFTTAGSETGVGAIANGAAGPDVTLPVTNYLFRNAERLLADVGFIDTIDLKSGKVSGPNAGSAAIGLVGVGKYVTPELYVRYSRDFSTVAEQKISAEYRVTRHLLLRGEQIRRPPANADQAERQYNLDLKVRLEY